MSYFWAVIDWLLELWNLLVVILVVGAAIATWRAQARKRKERAL